MATGPRPWSSAGSAHRAPPRMRAGGRGRPARAATRETAFPIRPLRRGVRRRSRSKNATCSASGHERTMLRRVCGDESVTNRDSSSCAGRMLQRPPPEMRIFRPPSSVRSRSRTSAPADAAKIAAMVPAAPAPTTTTRGRSSSLGCDNLAPQRLRGDPPMNANGPRQKAQAENENSRIMHEIVHHAASKMVARKRAQQTPVGSTSHKACLAPDARCTDGWCSATRNWGPAGEIENTMTDRFINSCERKNV